MKRNGKAEPFSVSAKLILTTMRKSTKGDVVQSLTKDFVGYGHYRLNVVLSDGRNLSAVTGNTELISKIDSLVDSERGDSIKEAIEFVIANN